MRTWQDNRWLNQHGEFDYGEIQWINWRYLPGAWLMDIAAELDLANDTVGVDLYRLANAVARFANFLQFGWERR